jgi:hypothetical protein
LYGNSKQELIQEDSDAIRDWDNFILLGKLPHELGYSDGPYHEDFEAIKEMKRLMEKRERKAQKKQEVMKGLKERAEASWSTS